MRRRSKAVVALAPRKHENTKFVLGFFRAFVLSWLIVAANSSAQTPAPAWPQFRGTAPLSGVQTAAPPAALAVKWTYDAGESVESSAAIADGVVYVGSTKGELLALDLETGKLRWKYATGPNGSIGESSPTIRDGVVFVGDLAGTVHAVSAADGKKVWTFTTDGEVKSSPVVADDLLLIGSYDTHLYALDRKSGKVRWKVQTDGPVHATAAVQNGLVYIAGCDERFRAVRLADGKVMFEIPLGSYTGASTAIDGDRAFVGTFDADVFALDLKTRKVAWTYRDPDRQFPYYSSAALDTTSGTTRVIACTASASIVTALVTPMTCAMAESFGTMVGCTRCSMPLPVSIATPSSLTR